MASVAYHQYFQYRREGRVKLFEGCLGYTDGAQLRDFVTIDDVTNVLMHFLDNPVPGDLQLRHGPCAALQRRRALRGEQPPGSRRPRRAHAGGSRREGRNRVHRLPEALKGKYQAYTQANLENLRAAGCDDALPHRAGRHARLRSVPPSGPPGGRLMRRAAFLDRDGVINIDHAYVHTIEAFEWVPGVLDAARRLHDAGFALVVVTNQSGIGRGYYDEAAFGKLTDWMKAEFERAGAPLAGVFFCPHHPEKALPNTGRPAAAGSPSRDAPHRRPNARARPHEERHLRGQAGRLHRRCPRGCPERVLLGTDGRAAPEASADATQTFRSLAEAVLLPWFTQFEKATR